MSSITAADNSNYGMESLAISIQKKSSDQNGKMAISLLDSTVQSISQIQTGSLPLASSGSLGTNINIKV